MSGNTYTDVSKKWYPPLGTDLSTIITDLIPGATNVLSPTLPNDLYGDLYFANMQDGPTFAESPLFNYFAFSIGDYYKLSGNTI